MTDAPTDTALHWHGLKAPSLDDFERLADAAFRPLPDTFRALCEGGIIPLDDSPTDAVPDPGREHAQFALGGLFQAIGLPCPSHRRPPQMPNMVWLYRRPILDYWADHDEALGDIITHVLVHEIGHHFGLSDEDMYAIERAAADAAGESAGR